MIESAIDRLVFFVDFPYDARDRERFGVNLLRADGFRVEVWDFTSLAARDLPQGAAPFSERRTFRTPAEAADAIRALPPETFVVDMLSYRLETLPLHRALSEARCSTGVFRANAMALPARSRFARLCEYATTRPNRRQLSRLLARTSVMRRGIGPASLVFAGGARSVDEAVARRLGRETLWIHALDYDVFLKTRTHSRSTDPGLGVFLDEMGPLHPDYAFLGMRAPADGRRYYAMLADLFRFLTRRYGYRIVVAAHPRATAEYDVHFPEWEVVHDRTAELVRQARFAIAHSSTSVNFALLYRKPVIFLPADARTARYVEAIATQLGKRPIRPDRLLEIDLGRELTVDVAAYDRYIHDFIKRPGTKDVLFWQQIADRLRGSTNGPEGMAAVPLPGAGRPG
jgi:hypothetical protein